MSCLFCEIAKGNIPSTKVYEDELVYAFRDIAPQGPVHVLIIPRKHIESAQALTAGVAKTGYRLITNVGDDAGQSVHHLHLHLIGGKTLKWDN